MMGCNLADYRPWLALPERAIRERLGTGTDEDHGVSYERLTDLTMLHNPAVLPARVYLRGGSVVMLYLGEAALQGCNEADLKRQLHGDEVMLPSRAGKAITHHVYPAEGVAYSADYQGDVAILEIFPPTSIDAYKSEVYRQPGAFIR